MSVVWKKIGVQSCNISQTRGARYDQGCYCCKMAFTLPSDLLLKRCEKFVLRYDL